MAETEEKTTEQTDAPEMAGGDQQSIPRIQVDDRGVDVETSDYWHMSGTPEEVIIRFGNSKISEQGGPVKITQRMVVSYYTAKRMHSALAQTLKRYEDALSSMDKQSGGQ